MESGCGGKILFGKCACCAFIRVLCRPCSYAAKIPRALSWFHHGVLDKSRKKDCRQEER